MELFTGAKGVDVLHFSAEEIAQDWRKGMAQAAAKLICEHGTAEGFTTRGWGISELKAGSLAEHFYADKGSHYGIPRGVGERKIASVTDIEEVGTERYDHDSFGPGSYTKESGLVATVTTEDGVTGKMHYTTSVGDLIYEIASQMGR